MRKEAEAKAERGIRPADRRKGVTVLGIGNILYSDEGLGVHILPELRKALRGRERVEIIEGATDGLRLLWAGGGGRIFDRDRRHPGGGGAGDDHRSEGRRHPRLFLAETVHPSDRVPGSAAGRAMAGKGPKEVMLFGI